MKIIIIGPAHPYRGGIADTNESFCRSLLAMGHDASILTFKVQYPEFLFPGKSQFTEDPRPEDLQIERAINTVNPLNWFAVSRKLNGMKPDIVIVRFWIPFLGPSLGKIIRGLNKDVKKIAMCDNVLPHESRPGDKLFTRYFLNSFDAFITLSRTTYDELDEFSRRPKSYFPHPINSNLGEEISKNDARSHLDLDLNGRYLLFFGLIRKYKGLDLTLKALAEQRIKDENVKLLVVGEFYVPKEEYLEMIREYGLEDCVQIIDQFIPNSDMKYYFSAADMVIQTYHTASQSGISQIAYNFNCPILVTDVGGLSEVVPHEKVGYVSEKDPKLIAAYIHDFYQNEREAEFRNAILIEKKKYSWEAFSEAMLELANKIT